MHVAIKQTVLDKILKRIHEIKRDNREPEYIVVSYEEFAELASDPRWHCYARSDYSAYAPSASPAELTISTREFPLRRSHYGPDRKLPYISTCSREKFMDLPLYVVPSDYLPA